MGCWECTTVKMVRKNEHLIAFYGSKLLCGDLQRRHKTCATMHAIKSLKGHMATLTALERLETIRPGFNKQQELLDLLQSSETFQAFQEKLRDLRWPFDPGQVLYPLATGMWQQKIIDQESAVLALHQYQNQVDASIIEKCLSGEFGQNFFAHNIITRLEREEDQAGLAFAIPSLELLETFLKDILNYILETVRIYLFSTSETS